MLKKTALFFLILLILSCTSTERSSERLFTAEDASRILHSLSVLIDDDISISSKEAVITREDVMTLVPISMRTYKDYLPLYDKLEHEYVTSIAERANEAIRNAFEYIRTDSYTLSREPGYYLDLRVYVSSEYEENRSDEILSIIKESLDESKESSSSSLSALMEETRNVKKNYDNLNSIGYGVILPDAKGIDEEELALMISNNIFDTMREVEMRLKNTPLDDPSSPYQVFWEDWN